VTRQQLRLTLGYFGELAFKGFSNSGVKRTSWLTQPGAIGHVLNESVLEQITRVQRHTLPEQQPGRYETVYARRAVFRAPPDAGSFIEVLT
jgi:hypothetical protein